MAESHSRTGMEPDHDGPKRRTSTVPSHTPGRMRHPSMPRKSLTGMQAETIKERQVKIKVNLNLNNFLGGDNHRITTAGSAFLSLPLKQVI